MEQIFRSDLRLCSKRLQLKMMKRRKKKMMVLLPTALLESTSVMMKMVIMLTNTALTSLTLTKTTRRVSKETSVSHITSKRSVTWKSLSTSSMQPTTLQSEHLILSEFHLNYKFNDSVETMSKF